MQAITSTPRSKETRGELPPLQPAEPNVADVGASSQQASAPQGLPKKRTLTRAACISCQRRKSKCSAGRPRCTACSARGTRCEYDTAMSEETRSQALKRKFGQLQEQNTPYRAIFELLQSQRDDVAEEIYKRIRAGVDPETVVRHVEDGNLLLQLSLVPDPT